MPIYLGVFILLLLIFTIIAFNKVSNKISQLSSQNRLLKALRQLDIVALSTNEIESLSQSIVNVVHKELGYTIAVIALADYDRKIVRRIAITHSPETENAFKNIIPIKFEEQTLPFTEGRNLFNKVIKEKKSFHSTDLFDVQIGVLPEEVSKKIQQLFDLKSIFVYPLISRDKVIGILEYTASKKRENLSPYESTIMEEFAAEVSRALENAFLYQALKNTSEQLEQANIRLQQLDKLKDDFVSVASHELRTPMTAIRSYVWMALHRSDIPLSQKLERYLYRTLVSTERLISLVNDMLNVSRIEAGKIEINPQSFDILTLVKDVVEEVRVKAAEKKLQLITLEQKMPDVFADSDKVRQILLNLIGNALKFSYPGGTISISFFTDGQMVDISVKDAGCGIGKDDLSKLFHKFSRLDNSYTAISTSGGTGLGLYICKSLVELMNGRIWVDSEGLERGTTFTFSLPIATKDKVEHQDLYRVKAEGEAKPLEPVAI